MEFLFAGEPLQRERSAGPVAGVFLAVSLPYPKGHGFVLGQCLSVSLTCQPVTWLFSVLQTPARLILSLLIIDLLCLVLPRPLTSSPWISLKGVDPSGFLGRIFPWLSLTL